MNDIIPPMRNQKAKVVLKKIAPKPVHPLLDEPEMHMLLEPPKHSPSRLRRLFIILGSIVGVLVLVIVSLFVWYRMQLSPVDATSNDRVRFEVPVGNTASDIAKSLQDKQLIRSSLAFDIYTRLSGTRSLMQAGVYAFSKSESVNQIVEKLVVGATDDFVITFLPGARLDEDRDVLVAAGYDKGEIDEAFKADYKDLPLFKGRPEGADLEGYIYGETYRIPGGASVQDLLRRTFTEYYDQIQKNQLEAQFKRQGLTLFQGITLASIIQREVAHPEDMAKVAQVFLKRLDDGISLGSDVTYQYAAKKLGVEPSPSLDSPYNTRKYTGLPPGPIAMPGIDALRAVANPAKGDYLYFLSGDDGVTYFARTNEEHEKNIADHCAIKCSTN